MRERQVSTDRLDVPIWSVLGNSAGAIDGEGVATGSAALAASLDIAAAPPAVSTGGNALAICSGS
jgi:hypothetical protein